MAKDGGIHAQHVTVSAFLQATGSERLRPTEAPSIAETAPAEGITEEVLAAFQYTDLMGVLVRHCAHAPELSRSRENSGGNRVLSAD